MKNLQIHIEQLMMEKLAGTLSAEDSGYLNDLIAGDEEIRREWEKVKELFERGASSRYLERLDESKAWTEVKRNIDQRKSRKARPVVWLAVAASILIPLLIAGAYFWNSTSSSASKLATVQDRGVKLYVNGSKEIDLSRPSAAGQTNLQQAKLNIQKGSLSYTSLPGQDDQALNKLVIPETITYKLTLSDGTEVWLNSASNLKFPFAFHGEKREVWLEGEAYFKVSKDARHPFIVHTLTTEIKVLGTQFNVDAYHSGSVKTALVEGSVRTKSSNGSDSVLLKPGYKAVFSGDHPFIVSPFDPNNELSWMKGVYYFQNSSLQEIAGRIRHWYGDTIVFENPAIPASHFTGAMFKDRPLKEFLDNLSLTSDIRYDTMGGVVHLYLK